MSETHKIHNSEQVSLSGALAKGWRVLVRYRNGNIESSYFSKTNTPMGISSMKVEQVQGLADKMLDKYISIENLMKGDTYKILPHNIFQCIIQRLIKVDGQFKIHGSEKLLISLIKKYEKIQKEKANDKE